MNTEFATRDAQADQLAEKALHELGDTPLDMPDDYAGQCDYAGDYPWLVNFIAAHPDAGTPDADQA